MFTLGEDAASNALARVASSIAGADRANTSLLTPAEWMCRAIARVSKAAESTGSPRNGLLQEPPTRPLFVLGGREGSHPGLDARAQRASAETALSLAATSLLPRTRRRAPRVFPRVSRREGARAGGGLVRRSERTEEPVVTAQSRKTSTHATTQPPHEQECNGREHLLHEKILACYHDPLAVAKSL